MKKLLSLFSALCLFSTVMAAEDEYVRVQCPLGMTVTSLTLGVPVSYEVSIYADSGVKSVKWSGLPSGLKYNAKTGRIEGAASKAGTFKPKLTFVTKAKNKYTSSPNSITVAPFESELIGSYKGDFRIYDSQGRIDLCEDGYITMKIAANGKCSGTFNVLYPRKKKIAIASGCFTDPQRNNSYFELKLKDGRTINLEYGQGAFGSKYLGHFIERSSYSEMYEVNISQDPFARADTKAFAKSLVGRKQILKNGQFVDGDYELTITSAGKVSAKGTWVDYNGVPHKFSISGGFLIPSLMCTSSTSYFTAYIPWPAENEYWYEYVKCYSNGVWSWWEEGWW